MTFEVLKVKENQEYYFRVYAENEVGISESGAELTSPVKIPSAAKPEEPKVSQGLL